MRCRLCGNTDTPTILSLGKVPLANGFLDSPDSPEELFDLNLVFCPVCSLVQITETIPPEKLFRNYFYFSSMSNSMLQHAQALVDELVNTRKLNKDSLVIELASNDGYLLKSFLPYNIPVLGIDPAINVAKIAEANGVHTLTEFFGDKMADDLPKADVIIALNVLGHVPDLKGFVHGVQKVLKPDGVFVVEVPSIRDLVDACSFDTIYFEHLSYFSLESLSKLFMWCGLTIARAEHISIHGGGYRLYVVQATPFAFDRPTNRLKEIETALGVNRFEYYQCFSNRVRDLRLLLTTLFRGLKEQGKRVVAYGAAAKGTMLLNYIAPVEIEYVVDSTPMKQGKFVPGVHLPIRSPSELDDPDYLILTSWNWATEIMGKHPEFAGRWIMPVPTPRIV